MGAGARGWHAYGNWALQHKNKIQFIAVAEPLKARREGFSEDWNIPRKNQFSTWKDLLNDDIGKIADVCFICTQDKMHTAPALKALELGYHVLLEKPMATTKKECIKLVDAAEETNRQLRICHVLRYTTFFSKIKQAINKGLIGDIININHSENVAYWHFAHSYVRGTWRRAEESSPIILAKTCHDLDILYWLVEASTRTVQSFGNLIFYTKENAPKDAPKRCLDGCTVADKCPWYAPRLYIEAEPLIRITQRSQRRWLRVMGRLIIKHRKCVKFLSHFIKSFKKFLNWQMWPATVISDDLSIEGKLKALRNGPWGRCVFHCDNNVPDHQTVNIEFENNVTATMTMQGHSFLDGRWIRISGTKGSLLGKFTYGGEKLIYYDHMFVHKKVLWKNDVTYGAHSDGDSGLMESFVNSLLKSEASENDSLTSARASLEAHLMGFAAEKSRLNNRVISMDDFRR